MKLRLLGQISLAAADGRQVDSILARPKATAVLLYLRVAAPQGYHRRDKLLALFWPEIGAERARHALRQTCYNLRRSLPAMIQARGAEEICVDPARLWCDVTEMERAFRTGRFDEVCELYGGEFADGMYIPAAAPEFEYWLSAQRERFRRMAVEAALQLADTAKRVGDSGAASAWAARALEMAPFDEISARRQVEIFEHFGDRAGALRAYSRFASRVRAEFDVDPSPETQSLLAEIRTRAKGAGIADGEATAGRHWRASTRSGE